MTRMSPFPRTGNQSGPGDIWGPIRRTLSTARRRQKLSERILFVIAPRAALGLPRDLAATSRSILKPLSDFALTTATEGTVQHATMLTD